MMLLYSSTMGFTTGPGDGAAAAGRGAAAGGVGAAAVAATAAAAAADPAAGAATACRAVRVLVGVVSAPGAVESIFKKDSLPIVWKFGVDCP